MNWSIQADSADNTQVSAAAAPMARNEILPGRGQASVKAGLEITFETLSKSENEAAVDALLTSLSSPNDQIQEGAVRALSERKSLAGQRELIRRWTQAVQRWPDLLDAQRGRMGIALREAVMGGDTTLCENAC